MDYPNMKNQAMRRKLRGRHCLDVLTEGHQVVRGLYRLKRFVPDKDYCDAEREAWIWSIGRHKETREIFAATDSRFYENDDYECLFLR